MANTKSEILDICVEKTAHISDVEKSFVCSNTISSTLHISRSLASQYLNELWRDGHLIKIQSHPTYFGFKKSLEGYFQKEISQSVFTSTEEFMEYVRFDAKRSSINNIFGYKGSLKPDIDRIIAGLEYPHGGLPIFIKGENGTGKERVIHDIYMYFRQTGKISDVSKYVVVQVVRNSQLNIKNIIDAINNCNQGIIYIRNVARLSINDQILLANILNKNRHYDNDIKINKVRVVASTIPEDSQNLIEELSILFPIKCEFIPFDRRPVSEREELVINEFRNNALILKKQIFISKRVLKNIRDYRYSDNIIGMQNLVSSICASSRDEKGEIYINLSDLPLEMLRKPLNNKILMEEDYYLNVSTYQFQRFEEQYITALDTICHLAFNSKDNSEYQNIIDIIRNIYDNDMLVESPHVASIVELCRDNIPDISRYIFPEYCLLFLNDYIYYLYSKNSIIAEWERKNDIQVSKLFNSEAYNDANFKLIIEKMSYQLEKSFNFTIGNVYRLIQYIILSNFNNQKIVKYMCIIVAHGRSTAHSIATAVNELLGAHVFDYFDMPLNTTALTMANRVKDFIAQYMVSNDVILLVDMGSLEKLGSYLKAIPNTRIGIINNVSTSLALNIGNKVLNGYNLELILKTSVEEMKTNYTLIEKNIKKEVVIFVSENNINTAFKMRNIFLNSLPKKINLDIIAMEINDYSNDEYLSNFKKYNQIIFVSGTYGSMKKTQDFIPIEELINDRNIKFIKEKMSKYLTMEELEQFQESFIYNFSLENILDSISILDVQKLMEFVKESVDNVQKGLNLKFDGSTLVGMYMHLCCMVERLVTKEPIKTNSNLEIFEEKEKRFVNIMRHSLKNLSNHYGIEIPVSEISYLYDYIKNDSSWE